MAVEHYENFPVASRLMPPALREPVAAIYWFARNADDIADEGDAAPEARLAALEHCREQLRLIERGGLPDDPIHRRLAHVIRQWSLPLPLFHDLLDAFSQDVVTTRYANDAALLDYCRRSANPVGRLLLCLYGVDDALSLSRSDAICSALQLINHWQDIAVDWRKNADGVPPGRVYIPRDTMARFGVTDGHLRDSRCDDAFRALMKHLVDDARRLMHEGMPLARRLPGRVGWELRLVVQGGLRILQRIEQVDYDVFRHRPQLRRLDWPVIGLRTLLYP
jgi:squalene synthase HpnC